MGENGSGKSTLLRCLVGADEPSRAAGPTLSFEDMSLVDVGAIGPAPVGLLG